MTQTVNVKRDITLDKQTYKDALQFYGMVFSWDVVLCSTGAVLAVASNDASIKMYEVANGNVSPLSETYTRTL